MENRDTAIGEILFVLGAPRSGTTLVNRLLLEYFDYGMGPEGHWIAPFAERAPSYGDLEDDANLERLVANVLSAEMFEIIHEQYSERFGWPVRITTEAVLETLPTRTYAGVAYAALRVMADQLRRSRVGSKDPGFYRDLDTLDALFPTQAKYLNVVRDGRDVALSMMQQPWGQKTWYANARLWTETYERIEAFQGRIPDERFHTLKYEDLLRDADGTTRALERFLDAELTADRRAALVDELTGGSRRRNYEKWKDAMSPRDHRLYESVAGPCLERLGYERLAPDASATPIERLAYDAQEFGRRAMRKAKTSLGFSTQDVPTKTGGSTEGA